MPIRPILQLGDPLLRQKAVRVEDSTARENHNLIQDLADTLAHWRSATGYGRGIAAPQLGELRREKIIVWDACLSFLSIFMQVERHREVTVRYQTLRGETLEFGAGDDQNLSELLQHEIDHLDGILAIDRVVDIKTICTREEFEKRYRDASPYAGTPATIES